MTYESESGALDDEILGIIDRWHTGGESIPEDEFNDLALRLFDYQLRYNESYARYCARLGITAPPSWERIPAVPAPAFRYDALTTFDPAKASLTFHTSGTTSGSPGRHFMETRALYDAALLAGFDRFVLPDGARLRYFNLVPDAAGNSHSSLGYMMRRVAQQRGDAETGWYLRPDHLLVDEFDAALTAAIAQGQPVCIAGTAFAIVHLLDAAAALERRYTLAAGSRIVETGGFKGRVRAVDRHELYDGLCRTFNVSADAIVSEYGMTELTSQYYARGRDGAFCAPPWLRVRVVGPDRTTLARGEVGSLLHVDLANRSSCIAIQTEDLGVMTDGGLRLLGRARDAAPRGCSLDAETLSRKKLKVRS